MNERIDQLWAQALDAAVPETYTRLSHSQVLKIKQVFAELIVRECINQCAHAPDVSEDWYQGVKWVANEIAQHFGVAELKK